MNVIIHKKGDTLKWDCTHSDANDNPINLNGMGIKVQAKKNARSETNLFDLSIGNGVTITDESSGQYEIKVNDTTEFETGDYSVDIQYTDTAGIIQSSETFKLKIEQDITR